MKDWTQWQKQWLFNFTYSKWKSTGALDLVCVDANS